MKLTGMCAFKIATTVSCMGEYPNIRYFDLERNGNSISRKLALHVQKEVDVLVDNDGSFQGPNNTNSPNIIIVDRSFDVIAPLVHEFTYQAMMYDLLDVNDGKYHIKVGVDNIDAKKTTASLDEYDPIWVNCLFFLCDHVHCVR
jgi:syntaxin-binding protein 1